MRWYRRYHDALFDPRLRSIARRAGVTIERAGFVYEAMYRHASLKPVVERGSVAGFDNDEVADHLMCPVEEVDAVVAELRKAGMVAEGRIAAWEVEQRPSDTSAARTQEYRDRQRQAALALAGGGNGQGGGGSPPGRGSQGLEEIGPVTLRHRERDVTSVGCDVTSGSRDGPEQSRLREESDSLPAAATLAPGRPEAAAAAPADPVASREERVEDLTVRRLVRATEPLGIPRQRVEELVAAWEARLSRAQVAELARQALDSGTVKQPLRWIEVMVDRMAGELARGLVPSRLRSCGAEEPGPAAPAPAPFGVASPIDDAMRPLARELGEAPYRTWIEPCRFERGRSGELVVSAPSPFHLDWVKSRYGDALGRHLGPRVVFQAAAAS